MLTASYKNGASMSEHSVCASQCRHHKRSNLHLLLLFPETGDTHTHTPAKASDVRGDTHIKKKRRGKKGVLWLCECQQWWAFKSIFTREEERKKKKERKKTATAISRTAGASFVPLFSSFESCHCLHGEIKEKPPPSVEANDALIWNNARLISAKKQNYKAESKERKAEDSPAGVMVANRR